tara:strand:+ start:399 stop:593 length:195 start_codon:yes stop_codon:yes gene_type:complete
MNYLICCKILSIILSVFIGITIIVVNKTVHFNPENIFLFATTALSGASMMWLLNYVFSGNGGME